jgi:hypothetical protein
MKWNFLHSLLYGFGFPRKSSHGLKRSNPAREVMRLELFLIIALMVICAIVLYLAVKFANEIDRFDLKRYYDQVELIKT